MGEGKMQLWILLISFFTSVGGFPFRHFLLTRNTIRRGIILSPLRATNNDFPENIKIELVSSKKRALDVLIFRNFSITPEEYISKRKEETTERYVPISEELAIDLLMPGYDDEGNYIANEKMRCNQEIYFAAIHSRTSDSGENIPNPLYARQNGVVGIVRAQKKNLGNNTTIEKFSGNINCLPAHVYLSNLSVHKTQRRRGIGTALLSSVASYAKSIQNVSTVLLDVELENKGAIKMYEDFGFFWIHRSEEGGTMAIAI